MQCQLIQPRHALDSGHELCAPLASFLLMVVSGWVHRHQLVVIECLQAENRQLKQKLGGKQLGSLMPNGPYLVGIRGRVARKALLQSRTARIAANLCLV